VKKAEGDARMAHMVMVIENGQIVTERRPGRQPRNPCECGPSQTVAVLWDHAFVPGTLSRYGCGAFGCVRGGYHVACSVCRFPAHEHPRDARFVR
jgi:hypothetical protein